MNSSTVFPPVSTTKRHRTSSQSSGSSIGSRQHVANKATRISPPAEEGPDGTSSTHPLLCTLPPTCNHKPTPLASTKELESHYATYHAHVCEQPGCGCVFPDARLLELHQTENHDPLAAIRKEQGEKIFACHLASCGRVFANPKGRRLHLISAHGYPKEYFFAVTNKGVGGLLKKWGEGASMVRGKWTPREPNTKDEPPKATLPVDKETIRESSSNMDVDGDDSDDDNDAPFVEDDSDPEGDTRKPAPRSHHPFTLKADSSKSRMTVDDPEATPRAPAPATLPPLRDSTQPRPAGTADSLASSMSTLSLVPSSVRFGRGGRAGFAGQHLPSTGHQRQVSATSQPGGGGGTEATQEGSTGRGHGGVRARGRGRGRGGRGS